MPGSPEMQMVFLGGVAAGIAYANIQAALAGRPIYCPPADFALNAETVRRYANRGLTGPHEPQMFAMVAVIKLADEFPCQQ